MLNNDLNRYIEGIYKIHLSSRRMDHAIRNGSKSDWMEFAPSKFIYSFFVFNSMYSINWQSLDSSGGIYSIRHESKDEEVQFKAFIYFAFDDASEESWRTLRKAFRDINLEQKEVKRRLEGIRASDQTRITKAKAGNAKALAKLLNNSDESGIAELKGVVNFIYLVRCNVFHGTKTSVHRPDAEQVKRFEVYACTLYGICEAAFQNAERKGLWKNLGPDAYS